MAKTGNLDKELKQSLKSIVKKDMKEIITGSFEEIVDRTPVDTGRAKRGWKVTIKGQEGRISNAVPYVPALINGSSNKAPKDFLQHAINKILNERK